MEALIKQLENYHTSTDQQRQFRQECLKLAQEGSIALLRSRQAGHFTASAWVVDPQKEKCLLLYHTKLEKWLQAGGHADGNPQLLEVAKKELSEESGLIHFKVLHTAIFDIDIHPIPAHKTTVAHLHYDLRFIFEAACEEELKINHESKAIKWFNFEDALQKINNPSIHRLIQKTKNLKHD